MIRFLTSVTTPATIVAGVVGVALLAVAWPIAEQAIRWVVPATSTLVILSPSDVHVHRAVALLAFALAPALAWLAAAARGFRRGEKSGVGVMAACLGIVAAAGAAGAVFRMQSVRALWQEASAMIPTVDLGSLDYWGTSIMFMFVTAAIMLAVVLRRR